MTDIIDSNDDECIHGLYPATACTLCNGKDKPKSVNMEGEGKTALAKYNGQCTECNLPIYADVSVLKRHRGVWYHRRCAVYLETRSKK